MDAFTWVKGKPTRYRSSQYAERGFCPKCGSTLSMHEEILEDRVQVTLGSLDEPDKAKIHDHVWTEGRIAWFDIKDKLPRYPTDSPASPSKAK